MAQVKCLGVLSDAAEDQIKKACQKMAIKWHPDKWSSKTGQDKKVEEEKFKEVADGVWCTE